ncbi:MAG: ACP S-malonyltransferase [Eubacteriales bacterium]|nr:ACP S-malonyltransferase [Eubacteriales bacterium]
MSKTAFMFPGQGAQYIGMGKEIAGKYASAAAVFKEASSALGYDIEKMIFNGNEDDLKITENTQPAILTASFACLQPLIEAGIVPDAAAGLSLGEYSAHVAAGTFGFAEAVTLVRKRGKIMQEAVPEGTGKMAAVIGLERELLEQCCAEALSPGVAEPANYNCPGQIVISGDEAAVTKAAGLCEKAGAKRVVMLAVSAPFHSSLMKPAGEIFAAELDKVFFGKMSFPVIANVSAEYISDPREAKEMLIRQMSSPVKMEDSIRRMIEDGFDTFIEIGPGKVISGFIKKINRDVRTLNVEDMESLSNTLKETGR